MSLSVWIANLKPLYKFFLGLGLGLIIYIGFRRLIFIANKEATKIKDNPKSNKLTELDNLKEISGLD